MQGEKIRPPHPTINLRSQQGRSYKKTKLIVLPSNQNIKLHESENAWKPSHKDGNTPEENIEIEEMYRKVRGILNKLTPQNFETLVQQVKNLNINTELKLCGVTDLIFENAIDERNFSVPYANMCKHLALIKVPLEGRPGQVNFRKLLITRCQREFEQDRCDELKREERMKALENADADKKKELQLEIEEEEKKMHVRQLGNVRFIGELFKLNMLIEPIIHECIKKLLTQGDEESLKCLCRLLKTIGKEVDKGKSKKNPQKANPMDYYFGEMQKIVDKRLTSSYVRFMLQDVIDLKKNNWVPRNDENNPKTIDQIHKKAEREAREAQQVFENMSYSKRMPIGRRKTSGRNMGVFEDGWTPASKSNKRSYSLIDPSKLILTKPMMPAGSANLEAENDSESYANQFVPKSNGAVEGGSDTELKDSAHHQCINEREKLDKQFSSVYSNPEGLSALQQNFENMLLKGEDHDVVLKVQEKAFKAHRNILRARSPVFAAMFSHDMKESSDGAISIDDCEADAFGDFLRYVYTARTVDLTPAKGVALYYAADKYDVPGLKETCAEFLKTSLTTTSVCDVVALAVKHGDSDLLERAATFFARHMEEVMVTLEWQRFITSNPMQASELCLKSVKAGYKKIDE